MSGKSKSRGKVKGRKGPRPASRAQLPEPVDMAIAAAVAADEKSGEDVLILDLRGRSQCADYFVVVTGRVEAHLSAIVKAAQEAMAGQGARPLGRAEAVASGGWALLDYGPVVVHAFTPEVRNYYDLELLWGDAPRVEWWAAGNSPNGSAGG